MGVQELETWEGFSLYLPGFSWDSVLLVSRGLVRVNLICISSIKKIPSFESGRTLDNDKIIKMHLLI